MSGTIPLSMTQQFDVYGKPLAAGKLYILQVGTVSTPQDAFLDTALTVKHPYPMTLDVAGRVPQFFLADGFVKIRLQDRTGVVQLSSDSVMVIGPSTGGGGGGGGGSTVDPSQLIQTGDMVFSHTKNTRLGFVRLNGKTIGASLSGATERANADAQALFLFLWPDTGLAVSGGRGIDASSDWGASKQLSLPDWRGYSLSALDDMGNTTSGRISSMGVIATTLGGAGGLQTTTIVPANLPPHVHTGDTGNESAGHVHGGLYPFNGVIANVGGIASSIGGYVSSTGTTTGGESATHYHSFGTSGTVGALSTPLNVLDPRKLITFFMKL